MLTLWLSFSLAFAIENLPCPARLAARAIHVDAKTYVRVRPGQFIVRGRLEAFHEQGMEDNVGWSIFDEDFDRGVFQNAYHALHLLEEGDDVFLVDDDKNMLAHYYFGFTKNLGPGEAESANPPGLFLNRELTKPAMSSAAAAALFSEGRRAVVVMRSRDARLVRQLRQQLQPSYAAYDRFIAGGGTQLVFAGGRSIGLRHFDKVYTGPFAKFEASPGRYHYDVRDGDRVVRAQPDAMLVFVGRDDSLIGTFVIRSWPVPAEDTRAFDRYLHNLIIIQPE